MQNPEPTPPVPQPIPPPPVPEPIPPQPEQPDDDDEKRGPPTNPSLACTMRYAARSVRALATVRAR
jgi:hypothetical protein